MHARRIELVARYDALLRELPELTPLAVRPGAVSAHHLYVVRLDPQRLRIDRDEFVRQLDAAGVSTSVHFIPIHTHPYYRDKYGYRPEDFPVAYRAFQHMVSLPLYSRMTDAESDYVLDTVRRVVAANRA